ncbi:MAG: hypothetical protein E5X88_30885 [Mesorhizobium sp.]|nr:MAG: hypothetical protein E5X88_30885 [Mesorhizobium sp.]
MAGSAIAGLGAQAAEMGNWITTWASTPAPRWSDDLPAPFGVPEVLENQTVRQVARISVGGNSVRVVLSNAFGAKPLTIGAGSVGIAGKDGAVDQATLKPLTWGGKSSVVIPAGAPILSDPVALPAEALSEISVSIFLPKKTALSWVHWDGVQTASISGPGNFTNDAAFKADSTVKSRLFLSDIWVDAAPESQAIVFFGDSITDGNCSTPDANNRWPDHVANRLQEANRKVAVVNEAFSGNRVLTDGMGVNALARFDSDVLSHPNVSDRRCDDGHQRYRLARRKCNHAGRQGTDRRRHHQRIQTTHRPRACPWRTHRRCDVDPFRRHLQRASYRGVLHTTEGRDTRHRERMDPHRRRL